jgi:aryl-alcohol dehydrogenase-like predicted oxidoreductase
MISFGCKKIALGTAQFGLSYGIANRVGQINQIESARIISLARSSSIDMLDTAMAYGSSENVLGQIGVDSFNVVTKLPPLPLGGLDVSSWIFDQISLSLARLKLKTIYAVLLHKPSDLFGTTGNELCYALTKLKHNGIAKKIGVSIYDPEELSDVMKKIKIDLVQAPLNVIDRRLQSSGWLYRLKDANIEVHVRSAFLQGLLLMKRTEIPQAFERWGDTWNFWHQVLNDSATPAVLACLSYPLSLAEVDRIVVGVDSANQFRDVIIASNMLDCTLDTSFMTSTDKRLINPAQWDVL